MFSILEYQQKASDKGFIFGMILVSINNPDEPRCYKFLDAVSGVRNAEVGTVSQNVKTVRCD